MKPCDAYAQLLKTLCFSFKTKDELRRQSKLSSKDTTSERSHSAGANVRSRVVSFGIR